MRQAREVAILLEITAALNAADSEAAIVRAVIERVATLCEAEHGAVHLRQGGEMGASHSLSDGQPGVSPQESVASDSIIGQVLATGRPYRCNNLSRDPRSTGAHDAAMGRHSQLTVPLRDAGGDVCGAVTVFNKRHGRPFTAHDESLLVAVADQTAVALARAWAREALATTLATVRESERFARTVIDSVDEGIVVYDRDLRYRVWNPFMERLTGVTADQVLGASIAERFPRLVEQGGAGVLRRALAGETVVAPDRLFPDPSTGRPSWAAVVYSPQRSASGEIIGVVGAFRDVTALRLLEQQLRRQACTDPLTGLANRMVFLDRVAAALAGDAVRGRVAVLFLDLDRFKAVNDSLGHAAGDELLVAVAERLAAGLPTGATLARLGGDEFTVLLEGLRRPLDARRTAEELLGRLHRPFAVRGRQLEMTASAGIAIASRRHRQPHDLMREADIALHRAKEAGKARIVVFDRGMSEPARMRLDLEADLRKAVARGELRLVYQPEVDLHTGAVVGLEALLRWQHRRRGLLEPAAFIPIAEETGSMRAIGRWVLEQACRQMRAWTLRRRTDQPLVVAVNLSAAEFQAPDLAAEVKAALCATGLDPAQVRLEIGERALMQDTARTDATLRSLRDLGVQIAIDDFGTGYSSLSYLRRFPVDTVKMDRSFVEAVTHDKGTGAIIGAVASLAHTLGMTVMAEGIETGEQLALVRALGCEGGQGFYFARPRPHDRLAEVLATGHFAPAVLGSDALLPRPRVHA